MTQSQMTAYLADRIGISKRQAKSALDELNELVTRQLKKKVRCASQASGFSVSVSLQDASGAIGYRRANKDSGQDPVALYTCEGAEGFRLRRTLIHRTQSLAIGTALVSFAP